MDTSAPSFVVAVGRRGSGAAIEYAAVEALHQRRGIHLVHAVELIPTGAVTDAMDFAQLEQEGAQVLAAAVDQASSLVAGLVPVTSALALSPALPAVVSASAEARMVFVGRCPEARRTHPYTRSVTGGVAARVRAPVVSVPDGWSQPVGSAHVVIGLDDPDAGDVGVLAEGFAAAHARRAPLDIVSTWWRPPGAGRGALTQVEDASQEEAARAGIGRALTDLVAAYDDVLVEVHVHNARPGEALVEASRGAALVVLGRHDHLLTTGSYLGPVARSVLRESACPVLLATPHPAHRVHRHRAGHHSQLT